jgi:hypothetical protein
MNINTLLFTVALLLAFLAAAALAAWLKHTCDEQYKRDAKKSGGEVADEEGGAEDAASSKGSNVA